MICESCRYNNGFQIKGDNYSVNCLKNGKFDMNADWADRFQCPFHKETSEEEDPPKRQEPNMCVVLAMCGRDFTFYVPGMNEQRFAELLDIIQNPDNKDGYVTLGHFSFRNGQIAMIAYLGK